MANFTLPRQDDDAHPLEEEDPNYVDPIEKKVKEWALKKMAEQFANWKKRLHKDFVLQKKTPEFTGAYEKLRDQWEEFAKYKKSDEAKKRSATNKKNASKKEYHHSMGSGGYRAIKPKVERLENALLEQGIIPETHLWADRAKLWFFGHGGTLHPETGKCIFTKAQLATPLAELQKIMKEVEAGEFVPNREKDELSRALRNPEHKGRTRGTEGSVPWKYGFPDDADSYRSRGRKKAEEADRLKQIEDRLTRQQQILDSLTTREAQRHEDPSQQDSGPPSQRKSSVASTELFRPDISARRYPVDDITERENCELHAPLMNITVKVAVGVVLAAVTNGTYHSRPIPDGYSVVIVDEVMKGCEDLQLDYPTGEGETALRDGRKTTVLWRKQHIVLPNWKPRSPSPPPQPSPPRQPSPPPQPSPPRQPSPPQRQPSPPPRQPSPPPQPSPPCQASPPQPQPSQDHSRVQKRKSTACAASASGSSGTSHQKKAKPAKPIEKLSYELTEAELEERVKEDIRRQLAPKRPQKVPLDPVLVERTLRNLTRPTAEQILPDYDRSVIKARDAQLPPDVLRARNIPKPKARPYGQGVPQLGQQEKQSCAPLRVCSDVPRPKQLTNKQIKKAAAELGVTMAEYLGSLIEYPIAEVITDKYKYKHGEPFVKPEEVSNLPTKMRRLNAWYMEAAKEEKNWINLEVKEEHYGRGTAQVQVEFEELFQLFQQDAIDKSIVSAYCL